MLSSMFMFLALLFAPQSGDAASTWSYEGDTGPEHWADANEICAGASQSPINIDTDNLVDMQYDDWVFESYDVMVQNTSNMINNGHTVQINTNEHGGGDAKIRGGGLPSVYSVLQFHFHWAEDDNAGSEHTRNGNAYPLEMHIVHWNSGQYPFLPAAVISPQGLAVLGIWIEVGEENPAFKPIIDALYHVKYKTPIHKEYVLPELFRLQDLLPEDISRFYRYNGSLTTPGCYESVVWTVFADPIQLSSEQIAKFREASQNDPPPDPLPENYTAPEPRPIGFNYRPVQDIGARTVYASFTSRTVNVNTSSSTTEGAETISVTTTGPLEVTDGAVTRTRHFNVIYYVLLLGLIGFTRRMFS